MHRSAPASQPPTDCSPAFTAAASKQRQQRASSDSSCNHTACSSSIRPAALLLFSWYQLVSVGISWYQHAHHLITGICSAGLLTLAGWLLRCPAEAGQHQGPVRGQGGEAAGGLQEGAPGRRLGHRHICTSEGEHLRGLPVGGVDASSAWMAGLMMMYGRGQVQHSAVYSGHSSLAAWMLSKHPGSSQPADWHNMISRQAP